MMKRLFALLLAGLLSGLLAAMPAIAQAPKDGTTTDADLPEAPAEAPPAETAPPGTQPAAADAPPADRCDVPEEIAPVPDPLPELAGKLKEKPRPLTIVVLGSLPGPSSPGHGAPGFAATLQAKLEQEFASRGLEVPVKVTAVGRTRATAGQLSALIRREVLPLKPALLIWQVGRADARQGQPPHRFSLALAEGLDILQQQGIATILADIQFHPQFEALFRTDDYRNYVRWVAGKRDLPLLRRYEMIEHWSQSGQIDLDSGEDADQRTAYAFIQECVAFQAARMILGAAEPAPVKRE
jgi:hypothetical protein